MTFLMSNFLALILRKLFPKYFRCAKKDLAMLSYLHTFFWQTFVTIRGQHSASCTFSFAILKVKAKCSLSSGVYLIEYVYLLVH